MSGKLSGRVAIVTGGARGQGAAAVRQFVAEGARVVIADVLEGEGAALARELGTATLYQRLDVADEQSWHALVERATKEWGRIDVLLNNAGILLVARLVDVRKPDFQKILDVNLLGPWLGIKIVAPVMQRQRKGSIINVCSTAALWGMTGTGAYLTSKWGLRGLTKTAAMELGLYGVRVNAIFPGGVNTPMANVANKPSAELKKDYLDQPIQRIGEPEEIARVSLFLACDDSSYLCGAEIAVDGGMTLGRYLDYLPGGPRSADAEDIPGEVA
jgi:3alpha(or 20beta)-hydroxysteroid dehydrogenase